MRATRAYLASFGTAGSLVACAAVLFVIVSALVAFSGWPEIAGQQAPAAVALNGPASGHAHAQHRPLTTVPTVVARAPAPRARHRTARHVAVAAPRTTPPKRSSPTNTPTAPIPVGGTGNSGGSTGGAGHSGGSSSAGSGSNDGSGSGGITVTTPTSPPVTVTAPTGSAVSNVSSAAAHTVASVGSTAGSTVGGSLGATVTSVTNTAGSTVSKIGATVDKLLGG